MNSIDDFARLRPEPDTPTDADLERIWARVLPSGAARTDDGPAPTAPELVFADPAEDSTVTRLGERRRGFALAGAAATLIVGVTAVALLVGSDRDASTFDDQPSPPAPVTTTVADAVDEADTEVIENPAPGTTVPGQTIAPTALEIAAAELGVNVELGDWELTAVEAVDRDGNAGGQWRYRSPDGGELDIELFAGGEKGFLTRTRTADPATSVELLGDFSRVVRQDLSDVFGGDRYVFTALVDEFDNGWNVEIDVRPLADDEAFFGLLEQIEFTDRPARRVTASELVGGVTIATSGPTQPVDAPAVVIGDFVALGAADELGDRDILVDAVASRSFVDAPDIIDFAIEQQVLMHTRSGIDTVVIHLGSNGQIDFDDLDTVLARLVGGPDIVLVTSNVDRDWIPGNNGLLAAAADRRSNVSLLDWASLAGECPGNCFYADDIHLTPDGAAFYAELIGVAIEE